MVDMAALEVVDMEHNGLLLTMDLLIGDAWIVRVESESDLLQIGSKLLVP